MIDPHWRRICGLHMTDDGDLAAVWLAHDRDVDAAHLYDCCVFRREVMAVIAEGINCRGRYMPVAWERGMKATADQLLERGVNVLPELYVEDDSMAEVMSGDVSERMRTGRFKVERRLQEWLDEFRGFSRRDGKIPRDTFPLMAATRCAVAQVKYAKPAARARRQTLNHPKLAVI
ncbi:MAG: hypothetical protein RIB80_04665 [Rhodospirillales bacterium]